MIGQPTDKWFYHKAKDLVGVEVNGTRFLIYPNSLGMLPGDWATVQVTGAIKWPFKKTDQIEYAKLPAWFQAGAPEWKHEFARISHMYRPIAWSSKAYED